jgi:4-amino-4-deoxy-L-arabinose transferase-like glycosyltransferase
MTAHSPRLSWILAAGAPLLAVIVYGIAAIGRGIVDSDEALYVQAAHQMFASDDWVTPYVNGLRYLNKPPLLIWLIAGSFKLFGVSELAARLPGLAGIALSTWLVQRITGRIAGKYAALYSGLAFAFCAGTAIFTLEVMTDIVLVFFLTLAMYCFQSAKDDSFKSLLPIVGFFAALGGAMMTKSLLGFAIPMGAVCIYAVATRRIPAVPWKIIALGCSITGSIVVPWHIVAELRNPGFLKNVIINQQVLRFLGEMPVKDSLNVPLWLFWILLLAWLFPWTLFLPASIRRALSSAQSAGLRQIRILCLSWIAIVLAVLSVSDRLEHYAFPILPPLAILIGLSLVSEDPVVIRWVRRGFKAAAVLAGLLLIIGIVILSGGVGAAGSPTPGWEKPAAEVTSDYSLVIDLPEDILAQLLGWPLVATLFGLSAGFFLAFLLERSGKRLWSVISIAAAMSVFVISASKSLEICEPVLSSKAFGEKIAKTSRTDDIVVILGDFWTASSIAFYTPARIYIHGGEATSFHIAQKFPDAPKLKLTQEELTGLWRSDKGVFVLGEPEKIESLDLPESRTIFQSGGRVLLYNLAD